MIDKSILQKAVRADTESLSGYILEEVVRMARSSDAAIEVEEFLLKALGQQYKQFDPYVKCKILKILRHICESGNVPFRASLQKKVSVLKDLLSYRAPQDPLHGDALNREVRNEADKCIKALYGSEALWNSTRDPASSEASQFYRYDETAALDNESKLTSSRIEGFGSEPSSFAPPSYSTSTPCRTGQMEGFGNPLFTYKNDTWGNTRQRGGVVNSVTEIVSVQAEHLVQGISQAASNVSKYLPESLMSQMGAISDKLSTNKSSWSSYKTSNDYWRKPREANHSYSFSGYMGPPSVTSIRQHQVSNSSSHYGFTSFSPTISPYSSPNDQLQDFQKSSVSLKTSSPHLSVATPIPPNDSALSRAPSTKESHLENNKWLNDSQKSNTKMPTETYTTTISDVELYPIVSFVENICTSTVSLKPALPRSSLSEFVEKVNSSSHFPLVFKVLLAKLSQNPSIPSVRQATTWQAKYRLISCLGALIDTSLNPNSDSVTFFQKHLQLSGRDLLIEVGSTIPKCQPVVDELLRNLQSETFPVSQSQSKSPTPSSLSADYLIDSSSTDVYSNSDCFGMSDLCTNDTGGMKIHEAAADVTDGDLLGGLLESTEQNSHLPVDTTILLPIAALPDGNNSLNIRNPLTPINNQTESLLDDLLATNLPSEVSSPRLLVSSAQPTLPAKGGLFSGLLVSAPATNQSDKLLGDPLDALSVEQSKMTVRQSPTNIEPLFENAGNNNSAVLPNDFSVGTLTTTTLLPRHNTRDNVAPMNIFTSLKAPNVPSTSLFHFVQ